jgi:hypothetical protein
MGTPSPARATPREDRRQQLDRGARPAPCPARGGGPLRKSKDPLRGATGGLSHWLGGNPVRESHGCRGGLTPARSLTSIEERDLGLPLDVDSTLQRRHFPGAESPISDPVSASGLAHLEMASDLRQRGVLGYLGMRMLDERQKSRSTFCQTRSTMDLDRTSQPATCEREN